MATSIAFVGTRKIISIIENVSQNETESVHQSGIQKFIKLQFREFIAIKWI